MWYPLAVPPTKRGTIRIPKPADLQALPPMGETARRANHVLMTAPVFGID
jgi:hypothetical protein